MNNKTSAVIQNILSMVIFGTIGIFVRGMDIPSGGIACVRGFGGALFLLLVCAVRRTRPSGIAIRKNLPVLCISGGLIGANWVLLFESYRFTTVAVSTLCYYMAPVFVILLSPLVLHERLTLRKGICVFVALCGMVLVSGVVQTGLPSAGENRGILLGLGAAILYATVVLLNQKLHDISAFDKTIVQLAAASAVILPYCLLDKTPWVWNMRTVLLLCAVTVLHTGIAYALYFGSMQNLRAQSVAIFSYIDPVIAVLLSVFLLREQLGMQPLVGAVLILGAAFFSELPVKNTDA